MKIKKINRKIKVISQKLWDSKWLKFSPILVILLLVIFLVSPLSGAPESFRANWDSGSLNADSGFGSTTASNDGTPADLVNPGYGGAGGAVKASLGQTLKYETADNLDKEKGEIEMKFKLPYDLEGNPAKGFLGSSLVGSATDIYYDSASGYLYIADSFNHCIVKTKMGGEGWTTYGSYGSGAGQFNSPQGIHYDSATGYLYIADANNRRIVKTKMGGTGWTTYGSSGSGVGQFNYPTGVAYDSASDYLYVADTNNRRIVKTKMGGEGWTTYGSLGSGVGQFNYPQGIHYDLASDYLYIADCLNHRIVKTKIDGEGWTTYGSNGSGVGQFKNPRGVAYDSATDYLYISDSEGGRIVKTKMNGTGWIVWTTGIRTRGIHFDSATEYIYLVREHDSSTQIIKTKIDGTGWTEYGWKGAAATGGLREPLGVSYDTSSGNLYLPNYNCLIKTKMDGTGWTTYGSYGSGAGQFKRPHGIYYDPASDYLYIADTYGNRVVKTKMDGTGWTVKTGFAWPTDVYYDAASEYLYVTERNRHRIVKTKIDGTGWTTYGSSGSGVGQFSYPYGIYYDAATEFIYVADSYNHRVVKTKMGGEGWTTYGSNGSGVGQFSYPWSLCYDSATDYLYVADRNNHRVVKTKMGGEGWATYGSNGSGVGQFKNPSGVCYDSSTGYIYVADRYNHRVVKTKIDGEGWTTYDGDPTKNLFRTSGANPMWLSVSPWDGKFKFYVSYGGLAYETQSDSQTLSKDTWHTIKVTYNNQAGETEILLDGSSIGSGSFPAWSEPTLGDYFYIGSDPDTESRALCNAIDELNLTSISADTDPPSNPNSLAALNKEGGGTSLTTDNWYNYSKPYFSWSGAADPGSSVQGYFVYFGTDETADPELVGTFQTGTTFEPPESLTNAETYYLRIKTRDYAYNVSSTTWAPFDYKYDSDKPTQVEYINVSPQGPSATQDFSFSWPQATDATSGVKEYVYKLGSGGETQTTTNTSLTGIAPYQEGDNVLFLKPRDYAGNVPDNWQAAVFTSATQVQVIDGPDVEVKSSYVEVTWISDKQSAGYVLVQKGNDYVSEQGHTDYSMKHTVKVVGLDSETNYIYKIRTVDTAGNATQSDWYGIRTTAPPSVLDVQVEGVTQTEARVSWQTSVPATSELKWGTSADYGSNVTITEAPDYGVSHSYKLTGLTPGKTYHVGINARDEDGIEFYSSSYTFSTPPYPAISNLKFEEVKDQPTTTLKITWATNVPTSSRVLYGIEGESQKETAKAELGTEHEFEISGLADSSTYKLQVSGRDQFGNEVTSDEHTYLTPKDSRPPKITDLVAEAATVGVGENSRGQIIVSWVTDEPATSQIEYGEGIEGDFYSSQTKEDSFLTKDHLVIVSDLDPSKPYHFRAVSKDRAGNPAYSGDNTAITGKAKKSVLQIIIETFEKSFGWLKGLGSVLGL